MTLNNNSKLHRILYEQAIELARARNHPAEQRLRVAYERHLAESGQLHEAGAIKEREGDALAAIDMYMQSGAMGRAHRALMQRPELLSNSKLDLGLRLSLSYRSSQPAADLVTTIAAGLCKQDQWGKAGELLEATHDYERALECYRKGANFDKAVLRPAPKLLRHLYLNIKLILLPLYPGSSTKW